MNSNQPDETQVPITSEEQAILEAIRQNPALKGRFAKLLEDFNAEVSKGMNELEAETLITKMVRNMGADLVQDWATHSEQTAVEDALESNHVIKQGKKTLLVFHLRSDRVHLSDPPSHQDPEELPTLLGACQSCRPEVIKPVATQSRRLHFTPKFSRKPQRS